MPDKELVPRTVPIIGRPEDLARAMETQLRTNRLLTHPSQIPQRILSDGRIELRPVLLVEVARPAPAPVPVRADDDPFAAIVKALAFVAVVGALVGVAIWAIVAAVGAKTILGGLALAVLICLGLANRTRHSGLCPGVAVHCKGCRGH